MRSLTTSAAVLSAWTLCAPAQVITTVIGTDWVFPSQPMPAARAPLGSVSGVVVDPRGNVYLSDASNNMVMRITPAGILSVVAGNGEPSPVQGNPDSPPGPRFSGDGGPATSASLSAPTGLALDAAGNLYIADTSNNRVRRVTPTGIITTVAGGGKTRGDGGLAIDASLSGPRGVGVDTAGNVYVTDLAVGGIRKVSPAGTITTLGKITNIGEGPYCLAVDANNNVYSPSTNSSTIWRFKPNGTFDLLAVPVFPPADRSAAIPGGVTAMTFDASNNLWVASYWDAKVYKGTLRGTTLSFSVVAGTDLAGFFGDGGPPTKAGFNGPAGIALDSAGNLYIADSNNQRLRKVTVGDGSIGTLAGSGIFRYAGDGGPASSAVLNSPNGLTFDASGNLYIADTGNHRVRKVSPTGIITTVAGTGRNGSSGDGGPATLADFSFPRGVAVDAGGNLYIRDVFGIRKVSGGIVSHGLTVGGINLGSAADLVVDSAGNLFIPCNGVCKVANGTFTALPTTPPSNFAVAQYLAVDAGGNFYFNGSNVDLRKLSKGVLTVFAGNGKFGFSGDGGPAINASLNLPGRITTDAAGNVYFVDYNNNRIRKVDPAGIITSVAGGLFGQPAGDGGPATSATLGYPQGLAVSRSGDLYVADSGSHRIRVILAKPPSAQVSPATLNFRASSGGGLAAAQRITVQSDVPAMAYSAAISTQQGNWLSVQPANGFTPSTLVVTADPTGLDPGFYEGVITISLPDASPKSFTMNVSLNVSLSLPPKLSVDSSRLTLLTAQSGAPARGALRVGDLGGGSLSFVASAATDSGTNWLTVAPATGSATPIRPVPLSVSANPASLNPGVYRGTVSVASPDTGEQTNVPITLVVNAGQGQMLLSQTGMTFQAVAGGNPPPAQNLSILNRGPAPLNWTASAKVTSDGPAWLSLSDSGGTAARPLLDVSTVAVSVDASGLAPGTYYGQIAVSANGGTAPAQTVSIVLVVSATATAPPQIQPAGLIFTGRQGDAPGSQNILVRNANLAPVLFNSARLTLDGADWLQYIPQNAYVAAAQPQRIVVQPGFSALSAGVHDGSITFLFADGSISVARVSTVVAGADCTPTRLVMLPVNLPQVFTATQNLPMSIEAQVVDDCGAPLTADRAGAAVTVTFSNGDRTISLVPTGNGYWSNTWQPVNTPIGPVFVTIAASLPQTSGAVLTGRADLEADLASPADVPIVSSLLNAASRVADAPVAPGSLFSLLGSGLTDGEVRLASTTAPQLFASGTLINAQAPLDLPVNTEAQLTVQRGGAISMPVPVVIAAAAPGIFTQDGSGSGAGVIADAATGTPNSPDAPARTGDRVLIYCTGLGAAAPVTVTIGGLPAAVEDTQPGPNMPGTYAVTAIIPDGVTPGDAVPVIVTAAGQTSPTVTMSVE